MERITDSISPSFFSTYCFDKPTDQWYPNLKESLGTTASEEKAIARRRYHRAIKPLSRFPKDPQAWISEWEEAMNEGISNKVVETQTPSD